TVVIERQRDIGLLRAVGATRRTIIRLILLESLLQGVVGTAGGLLLGYGFAWLMIAGVSKLMEQFIRIRLEQPVIPLSAFALAIIISLSSLFASIQVTFLDYADKSLAADVILLPPSLGLWNSNVGAGPAFERDLAAIPGIGAWAGIRYAGAQVGGKQVQVL